MNNLEEKKKSNTKIKKFNKQFLNQNLNFIKNNLTLFIINVKMKFEQYKT